MTTRRGSASAAVDAAFVRGVVEDFVRDAPENRMGLDGAESGFSLTPVELFREVFVETGVSPAELTVVSWILPSTAATAPVSSPAGRRTDEG